MLSTILTIALWQAPAGAQSPEVLLDRYIATGDSAVLDLCRSRIAELPRTNQSRLLEAKLLLAFGKPELALRAATALNRDVPDDLDPYAVIVDAALRLGDIRKAEESGNWMLRLRPEDVRSLMRGGAVREAIGDLEGAQQMLVDAFARTSRNDAAVRAAIGVSLARLNWRVGKTEDADRLLQQVEAIVPGYRPAAVLRRDWEKKQ